jgi:hypothetical protein
MTSRGAQSGTHKRHAHGHPVRGRRTVWRAGAATPLPPQGAARLHTLHRRPESRDGAVQLLAALLSWRQHR